LNISNCGLNISPEGLTLTPQSYQTLLLRAFLTVPRFWACFVLRCFQHLSIYGVATQQLPCQTTGRLVATNPRSSRTKGSFPAGTDALPSKSTPTVSRRSEPISGFLLMGEQPHPWQLIHHQDRKRRHRSSKPPGRYELLPATTQLSLG